MVNNNIFYIAPTASSTATGNPKKLTADNLAAHDKAVKRRHEDLPAGLLPKTDTVVATVGKAKVGKGKGKERDKRGGH